MGKLSLIIPSRNCKYVSRTVDDIYENATGDIEVIVLLDSYWPSPMIKDHPNLTIVHKPVVGGMRHSVNMGVQLATGKWIAKCDDHCMFGKGFDEILQDGMEDNWLVNPSRYAMDADKWERGRGPVEYLFLTFPYIHDDLYGTGMHGKKWIGNDGIGKNMGMNEFYWMENNNRDKLIDDIMTFQGSFWMMDRDYYFKIQMLDERHSDLMGNDAQELGFKMWLSGGRCVVNKNTWYAHYHKDEREKDEKGNSWRLSYKAKKETERFHTWYWMNDKWPLATSKIEWFVDHFWPIATWPENWKEQRDKFQAEHPEVTRDFRVFDADGWDGMPCG